jgi:uncharacterized membrane protein
MPHFEISRAFMTYLICQIIVILFFGLFTEFKYGADPKDHKQNEVATELLKNHYPCF